jgi:hypothetical protein
MCAHKLRGGEVRKGRQKIPLEAGLERHVSAYACAAAAGLTMLATTRSAEAKVVYTPASTGIPINGHIDLDLNHDGVADFSFVNAFWSATDVGQELLGAVAKNPGNAIWGKGLWSSNSIFNFSGGFASALRRRFKVGPSKSYFQRANGLMAFSRGTAYWSGSSGQWMYTRHRYLGLQFTIGGQVHYGWARVAVTPGIKATLTGYAYETIPNKPIITGKTKGPDVMTLDRASLGHLAQGASGISVWREKKK